VRAASLRPYCIPFTVFLYRLASVGGQSYPLQETLLVPTRRLLNARSTRSGKVVSMIQDHSMTLVLFLGLILNETGDSYFPTRFIRDRVDANNYFVYTSTEIFLLANVIITIRYDITAT
jgi:hypothetical protein